MTVTGNIQHLKRLSLYEREKPFQLFLIDAAHADGRTTSLDFEQTFVDIHDIRDEIAPPTLDDNGFTVRHCATSKCEAEFFDLQVVREQ